MYNWFQKISNITEDIIPLNKDETNIVKIYNILNNLDSKNIEKYFYDLYPLILPSNSEQYDRVLYLVGPLGDILNSISKIINLYNDTDLNAMKYFIKLPTGKNPTTGESYNLFELLEKEYSYVQSIIDSIKKDALAQEPINFNSVRSLISDKKFQKLVWILNRLKDIIESNYLPEHGFEEPQLLVQEISQSELMQDSRNKEPIYKYVTKKENPPWGFGWKIKNDQDEWDWWKTNWDTSD